MSKKFLSVAIVASVAATSTVGVGYAQETVNNDENDMSDSYTSGVGKESIFESGDGTQENPYLISNISQFKAFRDDVNNGNNYSGKYIKLGVDIDLNNEEWTPIGNKEVNPFNGNFDGDGKTISNIKVKSGEYTGLFGYSTKTYIKNINIKNIECHSVNYSGGIISYADGASKIENIKISGNIIISSKFAYTGGIAGWFIGSIENCILNGHIEIGDSTPEDSKDNIQYVGGIFGKGYTNVNNCEVSGDKTSKIVGSICVGGISGFQEEGNQTIKNSSVNNISVIGQWWHVGGISGIANYGNSIESCRVNESYIKCENGLDVEDETTLTIGTIAGANLANTNNFILIEDCSVKNTEAKIDGYDKLITRKISLSNKDLANVNQGTIVGDNITFDETGKKVVSGDFEILTSDMCQNGKKAVQIESNKVIIVEEGTVAVIKDGDSYTEYTSIDEAISNSSGKQIEVTGEISPFSITSGDVKIDLNGRTINSNSGSAITISGGKLSIKGGNISTSKENSSAVTISGGADVKFEDITFELLEGSSKSPVEVLNGGANIIVKGTIESKNLKDNGYVISNIGNGKVTLKIEGGSTSDGDTVSPSNVGNLINESKGNVEIVDKPSGGGSTGGGSISKPEYTHTQIIGKDRYETAAKLADKLGNYDTVILVNSDKTMADGLSAASLAGKLNAPILPVKQNKIPDSVMQRIEKAKNVYIIGGTEAISKDVENKLSSKEITRVSGKTRYETSQKIAEMMGNYTEAYIVNGLTGEADAMSISSVAAKKGAPIIVTDGKKSDYVKKSGTNYTVIGGEKAVTKELASKYSADRISGANRYETNRAVIMKYYASVGTIYLANGETMIDALTASLVAKDNGVVLVSEKSDNDILKSRNTIQVGGMPFEVNIPK